MSILRNWQQHQINDFRGAWPLLEAADIPSTNALVAKNVEYLPGLVKTRAGFSSILTPGDAMISMYNWFSPTFSGIQNFLAYLAPAGSTHTGVNVINLDAAPGTVIPLYAPAGSPEGATFAQGGYRLFIATYKFDSGTSVAYGSDLGRVYSQTTVSNTGGTDALFAPPLQYVPVITDTGTGTVTAGVHNIGYIVTTRNGFTGQPGAVNSGGAFVATAHTAPGGKQMVVTITPDSSTGGVWPVWASSVAVIMTTAGGAQYFFVPGASVAVAPTTSIPAIIDINIDDGTLAASGTDATPYFDLLVQSQSGTGPFKPSFVGNYGQRIYYVGQDAVGTNTIFMSNLNDYQSLRLDQNVIYLPGQIPISGGFSLYGMLYIVGPHWTYMVQDTGDIPVTWPAPQIIDGQIGAISPRGISVNSAQGFAWVADVSGLYLFAGGAYSTRPVSYYQTPDWNRINFQHVAAGLIQVIDNKTKKQVKVIAALDGAASPTHILTWDYTRGLDAESVSYSLDSFDPATAYAPGSMCVIENPTQNQNETWIGPSSPTLAVLRQNGTLDNNPYRDNGGPIHATYQTSLLPPLGPAVLQHHGDHLRLQGYGNTYVTVRNMDGTQSIPLQTQVEAGSPGQLYLVLYHTLDECASLVLEAKDLDSWFQLSSLVHYFSPFVTQR